MVWLDWMKVMAIFSIVWGHFFSAGHLYLYVFNVQVFCVISGFLYKRADSWRSCLTKCFWQLFVPTVILSTVMQAEAWLRLLAMGETYDVTWTWYLKWLLLGHRWCMGPCWYFYSLAVMRLVMQLLPERRWVYGLLFVALAAGAVALRRQGIEVSNANVNVLVCMPMFLVGVLLKPLRQQLGRLRNYWIEVALGVVAVAGVVLCGRWNGYVSLRLWRQFRAVCLRRTGGVADALRGRFVAEPPALPFDGPDVVEGFDSHHRPAHHIGAPSAGVARQDVGRGPAAVGTHRALFRADCTPG